MSRNFVHFLPLFSTIISAYFSIIILKRYFQKREAKHLLWWGIGVIAYGAGTLVESINTIFGWNEIIFKSWYILGALLGGAPLALGSLYLLAGKKTGDVFTKLLIVTVTITALFVIFSPIKYNLVETSILNSKVLEWQQIRMVSPFINSFAAIFLIGGAIYSAFRYFSNRENINRAVGNLFIAVGAILPGIGGVYSRMGHTEILYIGEFIGIILIWFGYIYCQKPNLNKLKTININQ